MERSSLRLRYCARVATGPVLACNEFFLKYHLSPQLFAEPAVSQAAKMAPRYSPHLALVYDQEKRKGNANRATLAVARKLVAYLMAVDRGQRDFQVLEANHCTAA